MEYLTTETILDHKFDIYGDVDNPWFMVKQIAEAIDYSSNNTHWLIRLVRDCDKIRVKMHVSDSSSSTVTSRARRTQTVWMINEDGFFDILMRSNVPIARDLRYELRIFLKELRRRGRLTSVSKLHDDVDWILGNCDRSLEEIIGGN